MAEIQGWLKEVEAELTGLVESDEVFLRAGVVEHPDRFAGNPSNPLRWAAEIESDA